MDDGGPSATMAVFLILIIIDFIIYGFGTAIHGLKEEDIEKKLQDNPDDKKCGILMKILDNPTLYVNTVQLIVLLTNVILGRWFLPVFSETLSQWLCFPKTIFSGQVCTVISGFIIIYVILTFGVLIPKKVAARIPEKWAYVCAFPINCAIVLLRPVTLLVSASAKGILYLFGVRDDVSETDVTEEEIRSMVTEGQEQGVLQDSEADMITNIFELSDKEAKDIMTHRNSMVGIDGNMDLHEAISFMLEKNNSRFPVYLDNMDHIIGILHIRDAMKELSQNENDKRPIRRIRGLLRQPMYVPETKNIDALFKSMQSTKTQMVIVIDEYGQTSGLVSMEDILEEIVGNILDEYDEDEKYIEPTGNKDEFIVEGRIPVDDLEKRFGIEFDQEEFETLNGLMIAKLDHIPEENEKFSTNMCGYNFRIIVVRNHMIQSVMVRKLPDTSNESQSSLTDDTGKNKSE